MRTRRLLTCLVPTLFLAIATGQTAKADAPPYFYGYSYPYVYTFGFAPPYYYGYSLPHAYPFGVAPYFYGYSYPQAYDLGVEPPSFHRYHYPQASNAGIATGKVTVTLPADAIILIDGRKTRSTGESRTFETPPIVKGYPFIYEFTAFAFRDRQWVQATERVVVWGGEETKVTFQLPPLPEPIPLPKPVEKPKSDDSSEKSDNK